VTAPPIPMGYGVPEPLSVMVCGDVPVLSVRVIVAESGPVTCGAIRTPILHVAPAARLGKHVFEVGNEEEFVPLSAIPK